MRRIVIAGLAIIVVLIGWIAVKDIVYSAWIGRSQTIPKTPDYSYSENWFERPGEAPPGGWATPWGVDILLIVPPATQPAPMGLMSADDEGRRASYKDFVAGIGLASSDAGAIYAPGYRSPSPASGKKARAKGLETSATDIKSATRRYLSADNRDRGLLIVAAPGTEALLKSVLSVLPDDQTFRDRFAGVILPAGVSAEAWKAQIKGCSPAFETCTIESDLSASKPARRFLMPSLAHKQLTFSAGDNFSGMISSRVTDLSQWLDANAVKPAEPFDTWAADEVVDVAPIRRPNSETDISGERGN